MQTVEQFRLNEPTIVHEAVDGEVVIINLESGAYYSLNKVGADVWEGLAAGASVDGLLRLVGERYEASPAAIAGEVHRLLDVLQQEQLIVPDGSGAATASVPRAAEGSPKALFEPCTLQKHTDVADLLLLDPVHDVDEPGWPIRKAAGSAAQGG